MADQSTRPDADASQRDAQVKGVPPSLSGAQLAPKTRVWPSFTRKSAFNITSNITFSLDGRTKAGLRRSFKRSNNGSGVSAAVQNSKADLERAKARYGSESPEHLQARANVHRAESAHHASTGNSEGQALHKKQAMMCEDWHQAKRLEVEARLAHGPQSVEYLAARRDAYAAEATYHAAVGQGENEQKAVAAQAASSACLDAMRAAVASEDEGGTNAPEKWAVWTDYYRADAKLQHLSGCEADAAISESQAEASQECARTMAAVKAAASRPFSSEYWDAWAAAYTAQAAFRAASQDDGGRDKALEKAAACRQCSAAKNQSRTAKVRFGEHSPEHWAARTRCHSAEASLHAVLQDSRQADASRRKGAAAEACRAAKAAVIEARDAHGDGATQLHDAWIEYRRASCTYQREIGDDAGADELMARLAASRPGTACSSCDTPRPHDELTLVETPRSAAVSTAQGQASSEAAFSDEATLADPCEADVDAPDITQSDDQVDADCEPVTRTRSRDDLVEGNRIALAGTDCDARTPSPAESAQELERLSEQVARLALEVDRVRRENDDASAGTPRSASAQTAPASPSRDVVTGLAARVARLADSLTRKPSFQATPATSSGGQRGSQSATALQALQQKIAEIAETLEDVEFHLPRTPSLESQPGAQVRRRREHVVRERDEAQTARAAESAQDREV